MALSKTCAALAFGLLLSGAAFAQPAYDPPPGVPGAGPDRETGGAEGNPPAGPENGPGYYGYAPPRPDPWATSGDRHWAPPPVTYSLPRR